MSLFTRILKLKKKSTSAKKYPRALWLSMWENSVYIPFYTLIFVNEFTV